MAENQIKAYRICNADYIKPHNGYGSTLRNGGRWNSPKHACIYSGSNRSIAQLEWLSHSLITPVDFPKLMMITYAIPGNLIGEANLAKHLDWLNNEAVTKVIGDKFLTDKEYIALKVPSALDINEYNYIINPLHPEFLEEMIVINDAEELILNTRFYEVKDFVKKAFSIAVAAKLSNAEKLAKFTSDDKPQHSIRPHRTSRRKR